MLAKINPLNFAVVTEFLGSSVNTGFDPDGGAKNSGSRTKTIASGLMECLPAERRQFCLRGIDEACEKCHVKYWYPNEAKTQEEQRKPPAPPK
jgi:hypothetical protein